MCGTPAYAAPEVYKVEGHGTSCDWWTLGILVHELLYGSPPFRGKNANDVFNELQEYIVQFPKGFKQHETSYCKVSIASQSEEETWVRQKRFEGCNCLMCRKLKTVTTLQTLAKEQMDLSGRLHRLLYMERYVWLARPSIFLSSWRLRLVE